MVSSKRHIMLISRTDGMRGPLGVARAVNARLADRPDCRMVEVGGGAGMLRLLARIALRLHGWSICIHANGYRVPLLMHLVSRINSSNRYFCVLHGVVNVESAYRPVERKDTKLEPYIFKNFQNVICVSNFEREKLFALYGARDRVYVIHNGVDMSDAGEGHQRKAAADLSLLEPVCITTGGFEQCKAVDLALRVLGRLSKFGHGAKLIVCGRDSVETGSNRAFCEQLATDVDVELVYEGEIKDKTRLQELYAQAHFYIGLSRFDTFNVSVLEGAAAGCIPVVSASCGAAELFDASSAVVVDIGDSAAIDAAAERMAFLASDAAAYEQQSRAAQQVAKANTWDHVAQRYWEILIHE